MVGRPGEVPGPPGREGQAAPRPSATRSWPGSPPPPSSRELADCDLVIESVVEDLAVKKHLFSELDRVCGDHTILATNTSTLPVVEMAMETGRPDKVCGIHFFNPAPAMALVEVVRPITASDETIAAALAFAEACGKEPVEVKDQAGLHRQRPAVPLPQQRRAAARAGRGHQGGHRRRHEGRLRVPHGALRPARPGRPGHARWPSSTPSTTSSATPTTPPSPCCVAWSRPSASAASPGRASTTTASSHGVGPDEASTAGTGETGTEEKVTR